MKNESALRRGDVCGCTDSAFFKFLTSTLQGAERSASHLDYLTNREQPVPSFATRENFRQNLVFMWAKYSSM
jgi:hypothetical protein